MDTLFLFGGNAMRTKQQLYEHLLPALQAHAADLKILGEAVSVSQLFDYCMDVRWRNHPLDQLQIHEVVASIFATKLADLQPTTVYTDVNEQEIRTLLYEDKT